MLMECDDCGHRWEINTHDRFRMDVNNFLGDKTRCGICESDKIRMM